MPTSSYHQLTAQSACLPDNWTAVLRAAENLRQVTEKLAEQRVQVVEPPLSPVRRPNPPLTMGRAHSANTELAELSIVHVTKAKQ